MVLLHVQGTFVECVGSAPVAVQLAACVLELVRSPGVHGHPQPYVRRSALLASAQAGSADPRMPEPYRQSPYSCFPVLLLYCNLERAIGTCVHPMLYCLLSFSHFDATLASGCVLPFVSMHLGQHRELNAHCMLRRDVTVGT